MNSFLKIFLYLFLFPTLVVGGQINFDSATISGTVPSANGGIQFGIDSGSTDSYVVTLVPTPLSLTIGGRYSFKANTANTGSATINFNSLGAKTIKKASGGITTDLSDNDIRAGQWVDIVYDGTNMQMQSTSGNTFASLSGNNFVGQNIITLGTNSPTPVVAETFINTTDSTLGVQSASPYTIWQGEGFRSGNSTNHTLAYRAYTLPIQGSSADPTAEWRLGLSVDGATPVEKLKVGSSGTTITSTDTLGQVLSLVGYYGTVNLSIDGSGGLWINTLYASPSDIIGTRISQYGNGANYIALHSNGTTQWIDTTSASLRFGIPAASPSSNTLTGSGARIGTDSNTSVTNSLNIAGPNGTGTGTGGSLNLGYIAPTTTGTAVGAFTSRITLKGGGEIILSTKAAPSSSSDTGTINEIRIDADYIYVCTATNTWKRTAISTW